jgi:hypothetical protein
MFMSSPDGGASLTRFVIAPGSEETAELTLPYCPNQARCDDYYVTLSLEHTAGAPARVSWEVIGETGGCGEVYTTIEEL